MFLEFARLCSQLPTLAHTDARDQVLIEGDVEGIRRVLPSLSARFGAFQEQITDNTQLRIAVSLVLSRLSRLAIELEQQLPIQSVLSESDKIASFAITARANFLQRLRSTC